MDYLDGKLVNRDTGEEVPMTPIEDPLLPDWLWAQHRGNNE